MKQGLASHSKATRVNPASTHNSHRSALPTPPLGASQLTLPIPPPRVILRRYQLQHQQIVLIMVAIIKTTPHPHSTCNSPTLPPSPHQFPPRRKMHKASIAPNLAARGHPHHQSPPCPLQTTNPQRLGRPHHLSPYISCRLRNRVVLVVQILLVILVDPLVLRQSHQCREICKHAVSCFF